jgi:hypothetical protein
MCISDDHRHCNELRPIHEVTENAKSSTTIAHIERDLKAIDGTFEKIKSKHKKSSHSGHQVTANLDSLSSTQMLQYCIIGMSTFLKTKHRP